jgi:hypothetical protein
VRVALLREALQRGAAGEREAEQAGALVEGLPRRVVERAAEDLEARVVGHVDQQRVPAGGDEAEEGRLERAVPEVQEVRGDVALEVVDGRERQAARRGDPLRRGDADEQRAGEAGALRDGDELDVVEGRARARERVVDDDVREVEVVARGDLGHDAAVRVVDALGGHDVGPHLAVAGHDGGAGVVAAGLDPEDVPGLRPGNGIGFADAGHGPNATGPAFGTSSVRPSSVAGVRHMMRASSPLSW